jgi:hypothetical protein
MTRWLLLGGLAVAIWLGLEIMVSRLSSRLRGEAPLPGLGILGRLLFGGGRDRSAPAGKPAVRLVRCAVCGQHVPENRARRAAQSGGAAPASWSCWPECDADARASAP